MSGGVGGGMWEERTQHLAQVEQPGPSQETEEFSRNTWASTFRAGSRRAFPCFFTTDICKP